jgi:hypothetical protein
MVRASIILFIILLLQYDYIHASNYVVIGRLDFGGGAGNTLIFYPAIYFILY